MSHHQEEADGDAPRYAGAGPPEPLADRWERWLEDWGPRLLLFARQLTPGGLDAEDVVQEAVVRLWKARGPGGFLPEAPLAFLTVRRTATDHARRESRRRKREQAAAIDAGDWFTVDPPDAGAAAADHRAAIAAALRGIEPRFREVIVLKVWGGLTFREIGEALELSPHTAASRYRYGLEALRRTLRAPAGIPATPEGAIHRLIAQELS